MGGGGKKEELTTYGFGVCVCVTGTRVEKFVPGKSEVRDHRIYTVYCHAQFLDGVWVCVCVCGCCEMQSVQWKQHQTLKVYIA